MLLHPPNVSQKMSLRKMKWFSKNAKPPASGFYYVRQDRNVSMRYFEDTQAIWWLFVARGISEPNDHFTEWLNIPGVSDKQWSS